MYTIVQTERDYFEKYQLDSILYLKPPSKLKIEEFLRIQKMTTLKKTQTLL